MFDTSSELVLARYKEGVRLCRPSNETSFPETRRLAHLYSLPINVSFLTTQSTICGFNETLLATTALSSIRNVTGKTILDVFGNTLEMQNVIRNDRQVLSTQTLQILTEEMITKDHHAVQCISLKYPCYDEHHDLKGIFCLSFSLCNSDQVAKNLMLITSLGLLHSNFSLQTSKFTKREKDILIYLRKGMTANSIATQLGLSKRTIETYIENIRNKTGMPSKNDLVEMLENYY